MTGPQDMLWMLDEYEAILGAKRPGFISGKPVEMGGSQGRTEATGYGVMITIREALKELDMKIEDTQASFQGFGKVAQHAIELYQRMGGKVTCVACWDPIEHVPHTYCKPEGILLDELLPITNPLGEIERQQAEALGYQRLEGEAWLEQQVDILVPAAMENQITAETAPLLNVKLVAEGANGPTDPEGDAILAARGIELLPDVLCNAGGVVVSYFEWLQNKRSESWDLEEVDSKLYKKMANAYERVRDTAQAYQVDWRTAAYVVALTRLAKVYKERGIFP
jgi:glutamate dehydrogenase (NAD(P)+)